MLCDKKSLRYAGFTLLEVLVAVSILAVLTAVSFSGMRAGVRIWTRVNTEIEGMQASRATWAMMRLQVEGALPLLTSGGSGAGASLAFIGGPDRLRVVSRASFRDGPGSFPRWVEYFWQESGGSGRLLVREYRVLSPSNSIEAQPVWEGTLLEGANFHLEYLPPPIIGSEQKWVANWSNPGLQMPSAVRFSIQTGSKTEQSVVRLQYAENSWEGQWFQ
jgi:general secretion pathway protein J